MATKKPSTATKKATTKKTTTSTKAKATSTKKKTAPKKAAPRSLRLEPSNTEFMKPAFTIETIYWIILSMAVVALGFWIATLQMRINAIYDQIDVNQAQAEDIEVQLKVHERLKAQAAEPAAE